MSGTSLPDDEILLLHAYADGELDAGAALVVERRLARDPAYAAEYAAICALSLAVRQAAPAAEISDAFLARIKAPRAGEAPAARRNGGWPRLALAASLAGLLAFGTTYLAMRQGPADEATATVLAAHMRGLATPQPFDVVSSDRHTVKPWFDGRLAFAPMVPDLASDGYPLAGGRLDAVGGQLAATLVYRFQQHVLTLTQARTASLPVTPPFEASRDGYLILTFSAGDLTCWVVTDLPAGQAREFAKLWQVRAASL